MGLRKGHGRGAGTPRIEVLPPDELPRGVQAPEQVASKGERDALGRLRPGSRTTQSAGGKARRAATRLARTLSLGALADSAAFAPYKRAGAAFRRFHVNSLAKSVGGGHCGPGPASIVATAAWQLAASRYLFDVAAESGKRDDFALASKLANDSRQNLLAAHELVAREAAARKERALSNESPLLSDLAEGPAPAVRPSRRPKAPATGADSLMLPGEDEP